MEFQEKVYAAAGLHLVVPEYNGSFPGALKYFIDMLRFPESFEHKPVAIVGVASGEWGGLWVVVLLLLFFGFCFVFFFLFCFFVNSVISKLDSAGKLTDADLNDRFAKQVRGFAEFAGLFVRKPRA